MERLKKILAETVFAVQVLIIFILVFEDRMVVPPVIQAFARLHPVLLHLPIGLLLVTVILFFTRRSFGGKALDDLLDFLLHLTAFTASFTALMGLLLSKEGSYAAQQLWMHKWLGVSLSFLCWFLLMARNKLQVLRPLGVAGVVVLVFTGHYGANLTHGENFVWAPLQTEEARPPRVITDSTSLFTATIEPIMESKCYGCHNRRKAKGKLVLTSLASMKNGGKDGALWKANDPAHSLLVKKITLPLGHKEHMPPKDKAQLTKDEIGFIALWIAQGADTRKELREYAETDTLMRLASLIIPRYQQAGGMQQQYRFPFASPEKIERLSRPNRSVFQIAKSEPAIEADFYLRERYETRLLDELLEVSGQLVSLNLSRMPVHDAELKTIAKFQNLEELNLNNTDITGEGLKELVALPQLRSVSLTGTAVSPDLLRVLGKSKSLKEVFVWNTSVSADDVARLAKGFPRIRWDLGYVPDKTEILKLSAPLLKNKSKVLAPGEVVAFKHNLPGTLMRYSLDGSDPDSVESQLYNKPLSVGNYATVKVRACKEGWLSSDVSEFVFFRRGFRPDTAIIMNAPEPGYEGEGGITLIDGNKGISDFYRDPAWMAFRENDLVADFRFDKGGPLLHSVTLSYVRNSRTISMPPREMELWGGENADQLKLLARISPPEGEHPSRPRIEGVSIDVPGTRYPYYRLVAKPMKKLARGNSKKRDILLMVDEVFFN